MTSFWESTEEAIMFFTRNWKNFDSSEGSRSRCWSLEWIKNSFLIKNCNHSRRLNERLISDVIDKNVINLVINRLFHSLLAVIKSQYPLQSAQFMIDFSICTPRRSLFTTIFSHINTGCSQFNARRHFTTQPRVMGWEERGSINCRLISLIILSVLILKTTKC